MKFTIHNNRHRAWPLKIWLWFNKKSIVRTVIFDNSCKYSMAGPDMMDTNKLFGIGYFPSDHQESARFGWRYDLDEGKIKLSAYCYIDGERIIQDLCNVNFFARYQLSITVLKGEYVFEVADAYNTFYKFAVSTVQMSHKKKWSYPLDFYFGGNKKAPHSMKVDIKKVK